MELTDGATLGSLQATTGVAGARAQPAPGRRTPYADVLAANVRSARARAGISQKTLADRMQALGFNWAWQTVGKVEKPNRPLLAAEILGLALALETTISELVAAHPADQLVQLPGGQVISPESVRKLACGTTDRVLTWDDGVIR
jgi:transcriptional regulator with XRE-family HTH domain